MVLEDGDLHPSCCRLTEKLFTFRITSVIPEEKSIWSRFFFVFEHKDAGKASIIPSTVAGHANGHTAEHSALLNHLSVWISYKWGFKYTRALVEAHAVKVGRDWALLQALWGNCVALNFFMFAVNISFIISCDFRSYRRGYSGCSCTFSCLRCDINFKIKSKRKEQYLVSSITYGVRHLTAQKTGVNKKSCLVLTGLKDTTFARTTRGGEGNRHSFSLYWSAFSWCALMKSTLLGHWAKLYKVLSSKLGRIVLAWKYSASGHRQNEMVTLQSHLVLA